MLSKYLVMKNQKCGTSEMKGLERLTHMASHGPRLRKKKITPERKRALARITQLMGEDQVEPSPTNTKVWYLLHRQAGASLHSMWPTKLRMTCALLNMEEREEHHVVPQEKYMNFECQCL